MRLIKSTALLIAMAPLISGCSTFYFGVEAAFKPTYGHESPDPQCERLPKAIISDPVQVDGILFMNFDEDTSINDYSTFWRPLTAALTDIVDAKLSYYDNHNVYVNYVAKLLLKTKLKYIEIEAPPRSKRKDFKSIMDELGFSDDAKYLRFSIAAKGDPHCKPSEDEFALLSRYYPNGVDRGGMSENQCIASYPSQSSISQYAVYFETRSSEAKVRLRSGPPDIWQIKNIKTGKVQAELLQKISGDTFCPTQEVREKFWNVIQANP